MKILIIDGANNFLRNYAVVPSLDMHGNPTGGLVGTLASMGYFVNTFCPDKVIICWDGAGGSRRRRAIIKEYKQGRKPVRLNRNYEFELENSERNKIDQRRKLASCLAELPIAEVIVEDIEADDSIAYLTKYYENEEKIIVSSDKDFFQLLNDKTLIYNPRYKEVITREDAYKKFSIYPNNFALARAIVGDKSDNLPGIRGIGMKNLLKYFPMFSEDKLMEMEDFFRIAAEMPGDKYAKFLENRELIVNNYKVMQLSTTLISYNSVLKIEESVKSARPFFNATAFRVKLIEDGITSIGDSFFRAFKLLEIRGKTNAGHKV